MWKPLIQLRLVVWLRLKWKIMRLKKIIAIKVPPRTAILEAKEEAEKKILIAKRNSDNVEAALWEGKLQTLNWIIEYGNTSNTES